MQAINKQPILKQELVNSIVHAAGILFGVIFIPYLIIFALKTAGYIRVIATCFYGLGFIMVFTFSTLYHFILQPKIKELLKVFDHISIYFLIAGTYTPLVIVFVPNQFGFSLLITLWMLTIIGSVLKLFFINKFDLLSTLLYILMGLILFTGGRRFFILMPQTIITLIIAGVVLYCIGVVFYIWKKFQYHHGIWHLLVLIAAVCHYFAILLAIKNY